MIDVREVETRDQLKDFIDLPWSVYRDDPNWVPPLKKSVRDLLDHDKHPFWEHARGTIFLAYRNHRPVGRISAQVDDNYNTLWNEKLGSFGFFECEDDQEIASALFDAAAGWLHSEGMDTIRGPMSPSSNDEWAWLLEGYDSPAVVMMPYNKSYYHRLGGTWGLAKAKDLLAFFVGTRDRASGRFERLADKLKQNPRISVRHVDMKNLHDEMRTIKDLYNASWEKNWGFSPMTDREFDLLAEDIRPFVVPELVLLAFYDGQPAGLSITLPDMNQVLRHLNGRLGPIEMVKFLFYKRRVTGARALVFGFKKEYRRLGLPVLLYRESREYLVTHGYDWCELSWNLEDNRLINDFDSELGGKVYKRYRVYEKRL